MPHSLLNAKKIVKSIRFKNDIEMLTAHSADQNTYAKNYLYKNNFEVNNINVPKLSLAIKNAFEKLALDLEHVRVFVFNSSEIQAECFLGSKDEALIRVSSECVKIFNENELRFIIGHELGHFLLEHCDSRSIHIDQAHAQEISADRVGLICSGSLESSLTAIMKTVSGLGEEFINFEVGDYLKQMNKALENSVGGIEHSTHPPMLIRSRALLWFSLSSEFKDFPEATKTPELSKVDSKIIKDLIREEKFFVKKQIKECLVKAELWFIAKEIFYDGKFTKHKQKEVEREIGSELYVKLINFFNNNSTNDIELIIERNLNVLKAELCQLDQSSWDKVSQKYEKKKCA